MKVALFTAGLMLAGAAQAAAPEHYGLTTAAHLAKVCSPQPGQADAATSLAFCHGVLAGAGGYYDASTPAANRFICAPDPRPTRAQVADRFVAWMKARPQYNNDGAIDALFRFASETFPCKR
jgi:Rap1a immunity proteins